MFDLVVLILMGFGRFHLAEPSCFDPNIRMQQLLSVSEHSDLPGPFEHIWLPTDQPSHLTPIRVHGGMGP